ncbi:MAG: hypothetical protein ACRD30_03075 [Bryobacteraceae bacterium]
MFFRICIFLLCAAAAFGASVRLYLKDGTYQLAREYQVKPDRVRYYSTEREQWEEIPIELVDLARTKKEIADRETELKAETKADAEENAAERAEIKQEQVIPADPGVYYIHGDKLEPLKIAESKLVNNKRRSILQVLSPVPLIAGKQTVELDGESAAFRIAEPRPEFYFRLSNDESFGIVRLTPAKRARVAEQVEVVPVTKDVVDHWQGVDTFKKQIGDELFKVWPEKNLEPGEYALVEYTAGKLNPQIWDFGIGPANSTGDSAKKRK